MSVKRPKSGNDRLPLRPELAAMLGVRQLSELAHWAVAVIAGCYGRKLLYFGAVPT